MEKIWIIVIFVQQSRLGLCLEKKKKTVYCSASKTLYFSDPQKPVTEIQYDTIKPQEDEEKRNKKWH